MRIRQSIIPLLGSGLVAVSLVGPVALPVRAASALVAWSDSAVHETGGSDVSVFALAPPYGTLRAQLVVDGKLVTNAAGITVTYEAVADATGSINTTSEGKGNFYQYVNELFAKDLAPDEGLAGFGMPGAGNRPQAMAFDSAQKWFSAEGIPVTPYDDQGRKNYYPLMRLVARNSSGTMITSTDVPLPVSDEMNCRNCHASGNLVAARPMEGWAWDCDPERDYKLNILRSHDAHFLGTARYMESLQEAGYRSDGLAATVVRDARPISCTRCHVSNQLPVSGLTSMQPLTQLMHTKHAFVEDPEQHVHLSELPAGVACLRCHAGPDDRRLRGVHHQTVAADGSRAMNCQSCHGTMQELGASGREGWADEPRCQSCHTGTATRNRGSLRYTSTFETPGQVREAVDFTYATHTNANLAAATQYRFAVGHGGMKCAACHGTAHAEVPSSQANDGVQNLRLQGDSGVLTDCAVCHTTVPRSSTGGPHGLHPVDQRWASNHEEGRTACQVCHGSTYRGTELSRMQVDNTFSAYGTKHFWRGFQVGCYNCHNGPNSENANGNSPAVVRNVSTNTTAGAPVTVRLQATDANSNSLTLRAVTPPAHGTVRVDGTTAVYTPALNHYGGDSFTYAAWDGSTDSGLGTVTVTTSEGECVLTAGAWVPTAALPSSSVVFRGQAALTLCEAPIAYDWDFGDGTPHVTEPQACHVYAAPGDYRWTLVVTSDGLTQTLNGEVTISATLGPPLALTITPADYLMRLSWPVDRIPASLEISTDPVNPYSWVPYWEAPEVDPSNNIVQVLVAPGQEFYRLRRVP